MKDYVFTEDILNKSQYKLDDIHGKKLTMYVARDDADSGYSVLCGRDDETGIVYILSVEGGKKKKDFIFD